MKRGGPQASIWNRYPCEAFSPVIVGFRRCLIQPGSGWTAEGGRIQQCDRPRCGTYGFLLTSKDRAIKLMGPRQVTATGCSSLSPLPRDAGKLQLFQVQFWVHRFGNEIEHGLQYPSALRTEDAGKLR